MFAKKRKFFDRPKTQNRTGRVPLRLLKVFISVNLFDFFVNNTSRVSVALVTMSPVMGETR